MFCCCCGPTRRSASIADLSGSRVPVTAQAIASGGPSTANYHHQVKPPVDLQTRRKQFWETAPTYGGRESVWLALRHYADTHDTDMELAVAVLESVGAVVRNTGTVLEVYDDSGFSVPNIVTRPLEESEPIKVTIRFANNSLPDLNQTVDGCSKVGDLVPSIHAAHDNTCKQVLFYRCGQGPIPCDFSLAQVRHMVPLPADTVDTVDTVVLHAVLR